MKSVHETEKARRRRHPLLLLTRWLRNREAYKHLRGRVLDVGCGENTLVRRYREYNPQSIGVDVFPWPGADRIIKDGAELPFMDGEFDTVTYVASLNHIPRRLTALWEARRVLGVGGRVVITMIPPITGCVVHWLFRRSDPDQREREWMAGERMGLTIGEVRDLLHRAGFKIVHERRFALLNRIFVAVKI